MRTDTTKPSVTGGRRAPGQVVPRETAESLRSGRRGTREGSPASPEVGGTSDQLPEEAPEAVADEAPSGSGDGMGAARRSGKANARRANRSGQRPGMAPPSQA